MRLQLLVLHVCGGLIGLASGALAIVFRKGSDRHRVSGNVFVIAMLVMGSTGTWLALMKHQINDAFGGAFTFYLIGTAWWTAKRKNQGNSKLDWIALLLGLAVGASIVTYGSIVALNPMPPADGVPVGMYFFMGSVTLLAAAGDLRMLVRGGISGRPRLVRHLWRMCFGLFIATGSFFLGQQQVFPGWLRGSSVLLVLALLPFGLMVFWVFRVRYARESKTKFLPREGDVYVLRA